MQKKVKTLIITGSIVIGLASTIGLVVLVGNANNVARGGETISFCAKKIGKTPFLKERVIKLNNHEFTFYNVVSGNDGSWILLDKTSYIINTDITFGFRYKNDEQVEIRSYSGGREPEKMGDTDLYPGYANYSVGGGIKLSIKDSVEDQDIPNGVNIGVLMHWCQQK